MPNTFSQYSAAVFVNNITSFFLTLLIVNFCTYEKLESNFGLAHFLQDIQLLLYSVWIAGNRKSGGWQKTIPGSHICLYRP